MSLAKDPVTGKYGRLSKTVYGSAKDADDALRDLITNRVPASQEPVGATLGSLLDRWLAECERLELSPTTIRNYRAQVEKTIRPALGKVTLTRLTAKHLDDLYGSMRDDGRSDKTIRNHHAIVSAAAHQAERWGWVRRNVAELAKPPRTTQRRIKAPTVEVVRTIIAAAEERDPRLAPLLMLGALGMRRGELCGLCSSDIDLDGGQLTISRSVITVPHGLAEESTKTDRHRNVALDRVAVALLRRYRAQVDEWARQAAAEVIEPAYVFSPYVDGGKPFRPDNVTNFFIRVREDLGLKTVRLHDLRHFTATQLIGQGVDVPTVAGRLGHSDPSVTLRVYSDVIEERDRAAASQATSRSILSNLAFLSISWLYLLLEQGDRAMPEETVLPPKDATVLDVVHALLSDSPNEVILMARGTETPLPPEVRHVLANVVEAMRRGQAITVAPRAQRLTTQQAADLLGISRPTLVKLLESGRIPFETPGRHRRIRLADLLAFQAMSRVERREALRELTTDAQEADLYDRPNEEYQAALKEARAKFA